MRRRSGSIVLVKKKIPRLGNFSVQPVNQLPYQLSSPGCWDMGKFIHHYPFVCMCVCARAYAAHLTKIL